MHAALTAFGNLARLIGVTVGVPRMYGELKQAANRYTRQST